MVTRDCRPGPRSTALRQESRYVVGGEARTVRMPSAITGSAGPAMTAVRTRRSEGCQALYYEG